MFPPGWIVLRENRSFVPVKINPRSAAIMKRLKFIALLALILQCPLVYSRIVVHSLDELKPYLDDDGVQVALAPGTYTITEADPASTVTQGGKTHKVLLYFTGSGSTYDFEGVTIKVKTAVFQAHGKNNIYEINVVGNNNVLKNLTLEDVGSVHDAPKRSACNICVDGRNNRIEGFHVSSRGSSPYGYGDCFGKGHGATLKLQKHSCCLIRGEDNHVKDCTFLHKAFGHIVFFQAAKNPLVEGCYIEGEMRRTDDILAETSGLAYDLDFMTTWGYKVPPGFMISCVEAGVRAYPRGTTVIDGEELSYGTINPTVRDCTMKFARTGCTVTQAVGLETVTGCTTIGCESGINANTMSDCTIDVSYGVAFYLTEDNQTKDVTITQLFEPMNGDGQIAYVSGSGHNITLRCDRDSIDKSLKLAVGGGRSSIRHQPGSTLVYQDNLDASDCVINNLTHYPLVLDEKSSGISGKSIGQVTECGSRNRIKHLSRGR